MNEVYQNNLLVLREKYPELAQKLEDMVDDPHFIIRDTPSGHKTLFIVSNGEEVAIHSAYNPIFEAKDQISFHTFLKPPRILVFYGLGFGYHLLEYLNKPNKLNRTILILEKELHIFKMALTVNDYTKILSHPHIKFLVGLPPEKLRNEFYKYLLEGAYYYFVNCIQNINLESVLNFYPDYYTFAAKMFREAVSYLLTSLGNSSLDYYDGVQNIYRNAKLLATYPNFDLVRDKFKGSPGILIASGPSLNHSFDFLRKMKNRAIMVVCDSALKPCLDNEVTPDFATALERVQRIQNFFNELHGLENICLFSTPVVATETLDKYTGPKAFIFNKSNSLDVLRLEYNKYFLGPTCGTMSFKILQELGCKEIYLVGQDLAYDQKTGKTHVEGTSQKMNDPLLSEVDKSKYRETMGNNDKVVATIDLWQYNRKILENMIQEYGGTVYNVIPPDFGAKITGTTRLDYREAEEKISRSTRDYFTETMTVFNSISKLQKDGALEKINSSTRDYLQYLETVKKQLLYALKTIAESTEEQSLIFFSKSNSKKVLLRQLEDLQSNFWRKNKDFETILFDMFSPFHLRFMSQYLSLVDESDAGTENKILRLKEWFLELLVWTEKCEKLLSDFQNLK